MVKIFASLSAGEGLVRQISFFEKKESTQRHRVYRIAMTGDLLVAFQR